MTYLHVTDRKYDKLSKPARRVIAALERQRDAGEAVWEISIDLTSQLADLKIGNTYPAVSELVDRKIIAIRYLDECAMCALVCRHADRALLDPAAARAKEAAA